MSRGLRRRIERMGQYQARQPGRMIVVTVAENRRHEAGLVDAALDRCWPGRHRPGSRGGPGPLWRATPPNRPAPSSP